MFRFLHAADIHLDSPLRGLEQYEGAPADQIRSATRRALENLVDRAIELKVDFLLIAGDLYDGELKDYNTARFLTAQMRKLSDAGIAVFLITGNHDAASVVTKRLSLRELPGIHMLPHDQPDTVRLDDLGVAVHGRGFMDRHVSDNVAVHYPTGESGWFNIGMLHTSLQGGAGCGHIAYAPCTVRDLLTREYQYWALGHIHQRNSDQQDPSWEVPIVFPGNLQGRHIRETGAKGCVLVTVDDRHNAKLEFVPLDVARWEHLQVDATGCDTPDDIIAEVGEQLRVVIQQHQPLPTAVRVTITGQTDAHSRWMGRHDHWVEEVRNLPLAGGLGDTWIEAVRFKAQSPLSYESDGPIGELLQYIDQVRGSDEALRELEAHLKGVQSRIANELEPGDDTDELSGVQWMRQIVNEAQGLLIDQLHSTGQELNS